MQQAHDLSISCAESRLADRIVHQECLGISRSPARTGPVFLQQVAAHSEPHPAGKLMRHCNVWHPPARGQDQEDSSSSDCS